MIVWYTSTAVSVVCVFCCLLDWCDDGPDWQKDPRLDQLLEGGLIVPVPSSRVANCLLQLVPGLVRVRDTAHLWGEGGGQGC